MNILGLAEHRQHQEDVQAGSAMPLHAIQGLLISFPNKDTTVSCGVFVAL